MGQCREGRKPCAAAVTMFTNSLSIDKEAFLRKFPRYDFDFLNRLFSAWNQCEGSTFGWDDMEGCSRQLAFHQECFASVSPRRILEVGAHKGAYAYFCKIEIPDVTMVTFGIEPESRGCIDMINDYFGSNFVTFIHGNSEVTLTGYRSEEKFDLAWIDGGHDFDTALSDLRNAARLNVGTILVDDMAMGSVNAAVAQFTAESGYHIVSRSTDARIIARLQR